MCYPSPGPRCSNHTKKALERASKALEEATNSKDLSLYQSAKETYKLRQDQYDATPAGQKKLDQLIQDTPAEDLPRLSLLKARKLIGQQTWNEAVQALHAGSLTQPQHPALHSRGKEAKDWSPARTVEEVQHAIQEAKTSGTIPAGTECTVTSKDVESNYTLTLTKLPVKTKAEELEAITALTRITHQFSSRRIENKLSILTHQGTLADRRKRRPKK